jgi:cystathionine gamma-synthase
MLEEFGCNGELCLLFPTIEAANECISYLTRYADHSGDPQSVFKVISFNMVDSMPTQEHVELHVVFFPQNSWKIAKSFWQHAGMGVSSRYAETCLSRTPQISPHQKRSVSMAPLTFS